MIVGLSVTAAKAQEISDALRYSQDNLNGTARFRAMGGAFGALGGDFSAINVNPAGSAIFSNNQVGFTISSYNLTNKSDYFGTKTSENEYTFDFNQAGGVMVFNNNSAEDQKSDWRKFTIAVNYENANSFDNTFFSAGTNPTNSIGNYFLSYANQNGGVPLNLLQSANYEDLNYADAQAFLGYQGFIINPVSEVPSNSQYVSNIPAGGNFYQENSIVSTGYNGKLAFNAAAQYKDWLYIGLNLNSHFTDYRQSTSIYEDNDNSETLGVQRLRLNTDLFTYGSGFSFQLGTIAKVTKDLRLGIAYESPTWYNLYDELSQSLSSARLENSISLSQVVTPNVTILYDVYKLKTPGKWTGSLAYVFGKSGLISADYSIKDYSNTQFRPESDFMRTNAAISEVLDTAGELRIGAEYRIQNWSLRAGYRMEESPYKDDKIMGDLMGYSGGLGYNFGTTRLDLSYSYAERDTQKSFLSQGFTDGAKINSTSNNVSLTLLFEL